MYSDEQLFIFSYISQLYTQSLTTRMTCLNFFLLQSSRGVLRERKHIQGTTPIVLHQEPTLK